MNDSTFNFQFVYVPWKAECFHLMVCICNREIQDEMKIDDNWNVERSSTLSLKDKSMMTLLLLTLDTDFSEEKLKFDDIVFKNPKGYLKKYITNTMLVCAHLDALFP